MSNAAKSHAIPDPLFLEPFHRNLPKATLAVLLSGVSLTITIASVNAVFGLFHWVYPQAYIVAGFVMSIIGWSIDRIWLSTVAMMLKNRQSFSAFISRCAFWCLAGGFGYTLGVLIAKRIGVIEFYDIPVTHVFRFGVALGCSVPLFLYRNVIGSNVQKVFR